MPGAVAPRLLPQCPYKTQPYFDDYVEMQGDNKWAGCTQQAQTSLDSIRLKRKWFDLSRPMPLGDDVETYKDCIRLQDTLHTSGQQ